MAFAREGDQIIVSGRPARLWISTIFPKSRLWISTIFSEHLIVIGGGYVGLELAQAYRRFGSQVTVIGRLPQPMGRDDGDVANEIQRILAEEGIEFLLGAEVMEVRGTSEDKVSVVVRAPRPKPPVLARRMCSA